MRFGATAIQAGTYGPFAVNLRYFWTGLGLYVSFATGASGVCSVQISGSDDPNTPYWILHPTLGNLSNSLYDTLTQPAAQIRFVVSSVTPNAAGGGIDFSAVQAETQQGL